MQKADSPQGKWRNAIFFLTAWMVAVADQLTKIWIRSYPEAQPIFKAGFFRLIHLHNTGAAFGLFQDQSLALTIVAFIGIVVLLLFVFLFSHRFPSLDSRLGMLTLGLVFGGTAGNLIDRLHLGYVTDFIDFGIWPTFNIADSAIVVGVIMFAYSLLFLARAQKP